jgi:hypothetical protein
MATTARVRCRPIHRSGDATSSTGLPGASAEPSLTGWRAVLRAARASTRSRSRYPGEDPAAGPPPPVCSDPALTSVDLLWVDNTEVPRAAAKSPEHMIPATHGVFREAAA